MGRQRQPLAKPGETASGREQVPHLASLILTVARVLLTFLLFLQLSLEILYREMKQSEWAQQGSLPGQEDSSPTHREPT